MTDFATNTGYLKLKLSLRRQLRLKSCKMDHSLLIILDFKNKLLIDYSVFIKILIITIF